MELSQRELDQEKAVAVLQSKADEMETVIPEVFVIMKEIKKEVAETKKDVSEIPLEIVNCKDGMEREMKDYMHDKFITDTDLTLLETKLEIKVAEEVSSIKSTINRASGIMTGILIAASVVNYFF